eukprot:jgi/Phyca11/122109/e_gw1.47.147.1
MHCLHVDLVPSTVHVQNCLVVYRLALQVGQLNLYHEGRQQDNSCRKTPACRDRKETLSHIFCAKKCWNSSSAARVEIDEEETEADGRDVFEDVLERLWRILATVCCTTLWVQRNRVTFEGEVVTKEQRCTEFQSTVIKQVKAIAKREKRVPETVDQGAWLDNCVKALLQIPDKPTRATVSAVKLAKVWRR